MIVSYSLTSTANVMTGGAGEPANGSGIIRKITIVNPVASAVKVDFYDKTDNTLTTAIGDYTLRERAAANMYGAYTRSGTVVHEAGTPVFDSDSIIVPGGAAPSGTGLPSHAESEAADYQNTGGVYTLRKYPGSKIVDTPVAANATTALVPFFSVIVPASSTWISSADQKWMYLVGIVGKTDNASAVTCQITVD